MEKILFITIIIAVLTSCSNKIVPLTGYKQIRNKANIEKIDFIVDNSSNRIGVNRENKFQLSLNDSVLVYKDTVFSNYKTFSFLADSSKDYKIRVYSFCDCLGFKKYMFNPEIRVTDGIGKKVDLRLDTGYFGYLRSDQPLSLNKTWIVKPKIQGNYNILLYSNNEKLQKDIYSFVVSTFGISGAILIPMIMPVSVKSTLVGEFIIKIEEIK